jgi:hypothetical protein
MSGVRTLGGEGGVELGATRESRRIGDDRMRGEGLQCHALAARQRVARRHQHAAVPAIAGQHHELAELLHGLGGDGEIDFAVGGHACDLLRRALVQVQMHMRVLEPEALDHRWQRIARLGVRGGDGELSAVTVVVLGGHAVDVVGFVQQALGAFENAATGRGDFGEVLARAQKDIDAQFFLEQADLFGYAGLRGLQGFRCRRHVEPAFCDFSDIYELPKLHLTPGTLDVPANEYMRDGYFVPE